MNILQRLAIFEAYNQICPYCDSPTSWREFEVDHIINRSITADQLTQLVVDYDLPNGFSVESFENWACSHRHCNRQKGDTTFNKSRALHYLLLAGKKARDARMRYARYERNNNARKVRVLLQTQIESGNLTKEELVDFVNDVIRNAGYGENNPIVVCFCLRMDDVYKEAPEDAPLEAPYIYDWLENRLIADLNCQLGCRVEMLQSDRDGETISVRFALVDLDFDRFDALNLKWWEMLELSLHTQIYGEFCR